MFRRLRKSGVEKEEIVADFIFMLVSFLITDIALFIFDIHWNFYPGGQIFPPVKYIFVSHLIYVWGGLLGAVVGLFIIKIFLYGLREEEIVWKKDKKRH